MLQLRNLRDCDRKSRLYGGWGSQKKDLDMTIQPRATTADLARLSDALCGLAYYTAPDAAPRLVKDAAAGKVDARASALNTMFGYYTAQD
jgi:hypothetical protein